MGYQHGLAGALYGVGGAFGLFLLAKLFAPVRAHRFMTMSEEISYYVGAVPAIKHVVACIIFTASVGWLGAHIIGGSLYLSWISGLDLWLSKLVIAFGFAIYVIIGGYTAVVWTDTIQAIVLFIGFILMAAIALDISGGYSGLISSLPAKNISVLGVQKIGSLPAVSLALVIAVGVLATPSFRQRIYSGNTVATVKRSFYIAGAVYLGFSIIPALIGMSAFALNPDLSEGSYAFPIFSA